MAVSSGVARRHPSALPDGYELRNYIIGEVLGMGGFAITYAAQHSLMHAKASVAIKEYLPSEFAHRDHHSTVMPNSQTEEEVYVWGLNRFIDEANILHDLSDPGSRHPNIVSVQDIFKENSTAYIVMDWVPGKTLAQCIKDNEPFPQERLTRMARQLLDALEFVHSHDSIHRDISPTNIIVKPDDDPVLIDFGAARADVRSRVPHSQLFKPGYSPIEQEAGVEQDMRADIYSLGATLYHAATGIKPPRASQRAIGVKEKTRDPLTPAVQFADKGLDPVFLAALDAALALERADRPSSVERWRKLFEKSAPAAPRRGLTGHLASAVARVRDQLVRVPRHITPVVRKGALAGFGLLAVVTVALLLWPTYEDHMADARGALAGGLDGPARQAAADAWREALEDRPGDVQASAGLSALDALDRFESTVAVGQIDAAGESLAAVDRDLAVLNLAGDNLQPFRTSLDTARVLVAARQALLAYDLNGARESLNALADGTDEQAATLRAALGQLGDVQRHLDQGAMERAKASIESAEGLIADLNFGEREPVTRARSALRAAIATWSEDTLVKTALALSETPLQSRVLESANAEYQRVERLAGDPAAAKGRELVVLLDGIRREAEAGQIAGIDTGAAARLAGELGYDPRFEQRLKNAAVMLSIGDSPAVAGVQDGLLARALITLGTSNLQASDLADLLLEFESVRQRRDELSPEDAALAAGAVAAMDALLEARQAMDRYSARGTRSALRQARGAIDGLPESTAQPFQVAIQGLESASNERVIDINARASTGIESLKQRPPSQDSLGQAAGVFESLLADYPDEPKATRLLAATGHLREALDAAAECDSRGVGGAIDQARAAWYSSISTEPVDLMLQSLKRTLDDC